MPPPLAPAPDPYTSGGGFIPEPDPLSSGNLLEGNLEQSAPMTNNRNKKPKNAPTIYYASRTHSQISQVIREYRKTSYRVPMAVLASRRNYCTNADVCTKENVDDECKQLLKGHKRSGDHDVNCFEFKNVQKVKDHIKQDGACYEPHDIEDLVRVGRAVRGCSYFAARTMAKEAQLVFCPYNYILNPVIRRAMEVDLKGAILILDEAHNIEDMARDAVSIDVEEEALDKLEKELGELCLLENNVVYQPLYDMIQGIITWIGQRKDNLKRHGFEHYFSCWTGENALRELQEAGISQEFFPILQECATKAIEAASDTESESPHLSSMAAMTLEGLFSSFGYFYSENGIYTRDYQLALQRYVKKDARHAASGWKHSFSLWCMNPAVVFKEIANLSLSVILTSGTLSPMSSFESELGIKFDTCMEAPHVIDVESQLWATVISTGPGNCQLNASYKTADFFAFQDSLGASIEKICEIVPGGALVFFPSYKLLEKLRSRWVQTGQWSRLDAQKSLFVEPRGKQDELEPVLKGYYDSICGKNRTACQGSAFWKLKRGNKRVTKCSNVKVSSQNSVNNGAVFLAVCRGKVSEGIDFSDDNARVVIIVGIPFPNKNDIKVMLKKEYNDTHKSSKNLLSGNTWYCHQAFRALNQAAGRCIRHQSDYGAVIFLDERFEEEQNTAYISKWLRKSIKQYESFDNSLKSLKTFFLDIKERTSQKGADWKASCSDNSNIDKVTKPSKQAILSKGTRKRDHKMKNLDTKNGREVAFSRMIPAATTGQLTRHLLAMKDNDAPLSQQTSKDDLEPEASVCTNENDINSRADHMDLGFSFQKDCRWLETTCRASSTGNPPACNNDSGPTTISNSEISHSTAVQSSSSLSDQQDFHSISVTNSNGVLCEGACTLAVTPERKVKSGLYNLEQESSLNLSVNSHSQKRRKPIHTDLFVSPHAESYCVHPMKSMNESRDNIQESELSFESNCTKCNCKKQELLGLSSMDKCSPFSMPSEPFIRQKLHILCASCLNPLGLPENQFLITCSLTSLSKLYLASLLKYGTESHDRNKTPSISVLISDASSIDQCIYQRRDIEGTPQHDIWSEEDGCVFRSICCPFCNSYKACLGVKIMATNSVNVQLLNKVIFFVDRLVIMNHEEASREKVSLTLNESNPTGQVSDSMPLEKYSYTPKLSSSGGWITTKSKLRLRK